MSPRARHADRDLTDPVGFAPVPADIPNPRGPEHSGGWAAVPEPSRAPDHDPDTAADRWAGTADRRRDAVAGDLFTPTGPLTPPPGGGSGAHGVTTPRRPARDAGTARPGRPRRAAGDVPQSGRSTGAADVARAGSTPGRRRSRAATPDPTRARRRPAAEAAQEVAVPAEGPSWRVVAVPVVVGSLVAVALGVWARQHVGTGVAVNLAGFSSGAAAKAWLGSAALVLAIVQGVTGRMMMRGYADPATAVAHRWSGRVAVLVTVPVAVQCLYAFGWSGATTSALLHSALGCLFYGAFVTKMLLLRRPGVPGWLLAVAGGVLLAVLAGVWLTSALWFFTGHGLSF